MLFVIREGNAGVEVLLLLRAGGGFEGEWCPVAGIVEAGEVPLETARRELREETALEVDELNPTGIRIWRPKTDGGEQTHIEAFVGRVSPQSTVILNYEHSDACWVSFDEAIDRVSLSEQKRVFAEIERVFVLGEPSREFDYYDAGSPEP